MKHRIHLVGIGGAGMSAIARVLHQRGLAVGGSDLAASVYSRQLEAMGIEVHYGHQATNINGADLVVASSAIPDDNVELAAARQAGVPVLHRDDYLPQMLADLRVVAVAGTHGKTTTTGLIAYLLEAAGLKPGFVVGGVLTDFDANAQAGGGELFVIEADEYARTFLALAPEIGVITNIEHDHPDCYPTQEDFVGAFTQFAEQVQDTLVVCGDDARAAALEPAKAKVIAYGFEEHNDWRAVDVRPNPAGGSDFLVLNDQADSQLVRIRLPGQHNVLNALAALAVSDCLGLDARATREALLEYHGVSRRFEILGERMGVIVVDDYAHHPTEIRATLQAARSRYPDRKIIAVFQPHTYSRLKALWGDFTQAFKQADQVVVVDVFASREQPDPEVHVERLSEEIESTEAVFISALEEAAAYLADTVTANSVVITLSAGDGNRVGNLLLSKLQQREESHDGN
ncbi:MAG: UDP-N-acetylmuramate--L-alanine ligase [Anaerolineales bacterium]|jgi:UDP-N-acetylmuramate--alanine ligase